MTQNCGKCKSVFATKKELSKHLLSHDAKPVSRKRGRPCTTKIPCGDSKPVSQRRGRPCTTKIPCGDCDEVFYRRCDLRLHRRMHHSRRRNCCNVCGRSFSNEKRFRMHYQFHNVGGEYECFYCKKEFNKGWKLKIHLVNHSGKPPYICQYCDEDFLYPGNITGHLKREHDIHLACKDCGEAFRNLDEQDDHICKLYGCKDCDLSFCNVSELETHTKCHNIKDENTKNEIREETSIPSDSNDSAIVGGLVLPPTSPAQVSCNDIVSLTNETGIPSSLEPHWRIPPPSRVSVRNGVLPVGETKIPSHCKEVTSSAKSRHKNVAKSNFNDTAHLDVPRASSGEKRTVSIDPSYLVKFLNFGSIEDNFFVSEPVQDNDIIEVLNPKVDDDIIEVLNPKVDDDIIEILNPKEATAGNVIETKRDKLLESGNAVRGITANACVPLEEIEVIDQRTGNKEVDVNSYSLSRCSVKCSDGDLFKYSADVVSQRCKENQNKRLLGSIKAPLEEEIVIEGHFNQNSNIFSSLVNTLKPSEYANNSFNSFKVPKSSFLSRKRFINILRKSPDTTNGKKTSDQANSEWEFCLDQNSLENQEEEALKSWLTSDNSSCLTTRDFVFKGVKEPETSLDCTYKTCKIKLQKEEYNMSFEDLCQL